MKQTATIMIVLAFLVSLQSCSPKHNQNSSAVDSVTVASTEDYYTCPMHPFVRSDRPGACPVCGMALVKKSAANKLTADQLSSLERVSLSPAQRVLANVNTAIVKRQTLEKEITTVGIVSVAEPLQATIAARFRGRVEKVYADYTGIVVKKDQALFELYSPEITSAAQDYILALNAQRPDTSDPQAVSPQQGLIAASRTRLQNHFGMTDPQISALVKTRKIPTSVRFDSPIRGTVLSKEVQEGQYVDEGMVLYQLADLSKVWMYLDVYEQNMRYLSVGQSISITTDAYPGEEFEGRVTFIDPTMNSETRTVRVRTEVPNPNARLKPNMYVQAHIKVPIEKTLVIPTSAVIQTGKRSVVWVEVKENTFEPRTVALGSSTSDQVEVLHGLNDGDVIAVSGGFLIDSESQLSQSAAPSSAPPDTGTESITAPERDVMAQPSKVLKNLKKSVSIVNVDVLVHGSYAPDIIQAKVGEKLRIHFYRDEDSGCTSEVVFDGFDIRRSLPMGDTVIVEITPKKTGTIDFHCGMGMVRGKVVVSR